MSNDPATPPLEWIREGEAVEPPEHPEPVHELVTGEESMEEFMELLEWSSPVGMGSPAGLESVRCAARFERELDAPCGWTIEAVLRRRTEDTGVVVYARAVIGSGAEQPACRALASCSSQAWARRPEVPMPASLGDEFQLSAVGRNSFWTANRGVDAITYYRNVAARNRREVEEMQAIARGPTQVSPVSIAWNMGFAQRRVDEFECMLEVLEDRPEPCGT